jgi:membrane protease YdiL (CAAX protease family)
MNDRTLRRLELALVLAVAFTGAWFGSASAAYWSRIGLSAVPKNLRVLHMMAVEATALAVLAYVLFRQGCSFRHIGLSANWRDIPSSVLIALGSYAAYYGIYFGVWYAYYYLTHGHTLPQHHAPTLLTSGPWSIGLIFVVILNPFFEELIVRAYTISEVRALGGTAAVAVLISVALKTSYHLYQGLPMVLPIAAGFLVYSIYYSRYGRIFPVILAHCYCDAIAMVFSSHH